MTLGRDNGHLTGQSASVACPSDLGGELHAIKVPGWGPEGSDKTIKVRLANTDGRRNAARMLINKKYAWRGYGDDHQLVFGAARTTFTAYDDDNVIGTLTLAVDSADGLAADTLFADEINTFRSLPGARVCELTKLAFDATVPSKPLLASFFHIIFIYGQRRHNCTDLFIEVNPRHRRFYEAMLGFQRIGGLKLNESVGAPSQLMWLKVADIRTSIDRYAGQGCDATTRSLYPFFFSPREEHGIYARLAGNVPVATPSMQMRHAYPKFIAGLYEARSSANL
jgi:hypothetical protein